MDSAKLYDKRINNLMSEIRNLKTAHFKTATTINTMELNKTVNFSLTLDSLSGQVFSTQRAIITMTSEDGSNMISACYLNGITPSNIDDRYVFVKRISSDDGQRKYEVVVFSQNADDWNTLWGGGSVNLSYSLRLVGSSKFTASVSYRNILGGSS